jgi:flagellar hook assembly protein FlgD
MAIYDVSGNEANGLINQRQSAGVHQVTWDAKNQAGQAVLRVFYFITIKMRAVFGDSEVSLFEIVG